MAWDVAKENGWRGNVLENIWERRDTAERRFKRRGPDAAASFFGQACEHGGILDLAEGLRRDAPRTYKSNETRPRRAPDDGGVWRNAFVIMGEVKAIGKDVFARGQHHLDAAGTIFG